jgi:hypothetical protein
MKNNRDTFVPVEKEQYIVCNLIKCMAGMGLAGNGHCYLAGDPFNPKCSRFIDEDKVMTEYEKKFKSDPVEDYNDSTEVI